MVASVPYVKATEPHLLETYTPEVTNAYITSRLESVAVVVQENLEDPLEDLGMVQQQLEQLSVIGRCEYQKTCTLLVQLFDQAARTYQELMAIPRTSGVVSPTQHVEITVQEGNRKSRNLQIPRMGNGNNVVFR
jgi:exportin-7